MKKSELIKLLIEYLDEAALEIEQAMVESMEKYTPNISSAASAALMCRWSKKAERVFNDGRCGSQSNDC